MTDSNNKVSNNKVSGHLLPRIFRPLIAHRNSPIAILTVIPKKCEHLGCLKLDIIKRLFCYLLGCWQLVVAGLYVQTSVALAHSREAIVDEPVSALSANVDHEPGLMFEVTEFGLKIIWRVRAWEVLGFESPPQTPTQEKIWSESLHWLQKPEVLWRLNAAAGCQERQKDLHLPQTAELANQFKRTPYFQLVVNYRCEMPNELKEFEFTAFVLFPLLKEVALIDEGEQSQKLLTPGNQLVNLCHLLGSMIGTDQRGCEHSSVIAQ